MVYWHDAPDPIFCFIVWEVFIYEFRLIHKLFKKLNYVSQLT